MAQKFTVEVSSKQQITEHIYFVTFALKEPDTIAFRAGQNMMLMIAPGINRTMSIASAPNQSHELLMVHDVSPMGPGSQWTLALNVGDKATIVAPTGGMLSFADSAKKKVMVATGTGVAPFHAMIVDYLSKPKEEAPASLVLYWGLRHEKDRYWVDEFDELAVREPRFMWHPVLSQPESVWSGLHGHVTEHVVTEQNLVDHEYYLCGSNAMIVEMKQALLDKNVPNAQIKTELFY